MLLQHVAATHIEQQECDCACAAICILLGATVGQVQDRLVSVVQRASSHTQRSVRCPHEHTQRETHTQTEHKRLGVTQSLCKSRANHEVARSRIKLVRVVRVVRVACFSVTRRVALP